MTIQGIDLEFDEESHTYLADGVIVPSVTTAMKLHPLFKDKYAGIDRTILNNAARRGTSIHKAIEMYCKGEEVTEHADEVRGFKFLQKQYDITPLLNEQPILIFNGGRPVLAGTFDLLANIGGVLTLADIKSTSSLDIKYLEYQLNLYRVGLCQSYGQDVEALAGIWLKGDKRKLEKITIDDFKVKEIFDLLERGNDEQSNN